MIICGTGHRPDKLGGYGEATALRCVNLAQSYLKTKRPDVVISGMALGWDQALALAAILEKIEVWAYVPFKGQESMWPAQSKAIYHEILGRCDTVHYVSSAGYAAWKMQERNKAMVNDADLVLALWNGSDGGTANCIAYAEKKGKSILNLWLEFQGTK
jgi:uncharacterized phage-like protein YoqJ